MELSLGRSPRALLPALKYFKQVLLSYTTTPYQSVPATRRVTLTVFSHLLPLLSVLLMYRNLITIQ